MATQSTIKTTNDTAKINIYKGGLYEDRRANIGEDNEDSSLVVVMAIEDFERTDATFRGVVLYVEGKTPEDWQIGSVVQIKLADYRYFTDELILKS